MKPNERSRVALTRWIRLAAVLAALLVLSAGIVVQAQEGPALQSLRPRPALRGTGVGQEQDLFPAFVRTPGVVPEGVAVDRVGNVYITVREGDNGSIWKFTPGGEMSCFANVGRGLIGGLAVRPDGELYVAMAGGADRGVYRLDRLGRMDRVPGTEKIVFANALAFDRRGVLYITESYSMDAPPAYSQGGVWRVEPGGERAEPWVRHPLLTGVGAVLGYPVGANGIGFYHGDLYVANTDKGLIVRIAILPDGTAGTPEVWAQLREVPGTPLSGKPIPVMVDGLTVDGQGNVFVTAITRNAILRFDGDDRSQHTVAAFVFAPNPAVPLAAPLDTPASLAFGTAASGRHTLYVTNLAMMGNIIPGPPWPGAGVVRIDMEKSK